MPEFLIYAFIIFIVAVSEMKKRRRRKQKRQASQKQQQRIGANTVKQQPKTSFVDSLIGRYETMMADIYKEAKPFLSESAQKSLEKYNPWQQKSNQQKKSDKSPWGKTDSTPQIETVEDNNPKPESIAVERIVADQQKTEPTKKPSHKNSFSPKQAFIYKELFDKPIGLRSD